MSAVSGFNGTRIPDAARGATTSIRYLTAYTVWIIATAILRLDRWEARYAARYARPTLTIAALLVVAAIGALVVIR